MSDDRFGVALTNCFYCQESNEIVINKRLTKPMADKVKQLDGHVINMNPCSTCEGYMQQGVILITIDPVKSEKDWNIPPDDEKKREGWMPNPHRSGGWFVVRDEAVRRMFTGEDEDFGGSVVEWALEHRWMFMEHDVAVMLGLFELAEQQEGEE